MNSEPGASVSEMFTGMTVPKVTEEGLFGGPYVRQGPLLMTVGTWMFQCGSLLGYGLKGNPLILGKLLGIPADRSEEYVRDVLQKLASKQLAQAPGKDKTLGQLYLLPTLAEAGYEITPGAKWMDVKIKEDKMIFNSVNTAFQKGTAVGFHFLKEFQAYWANTYKPRSEEEWDELYRIGIVLTPQQTILILEDEVCNVLADSADWMEENAPNQLTVNELSILKKLAGEQTKTVEESQSVKIVDEGIPKLTNKERQEKLANIKEQIEQQVNETKRQTQEEDKHTTHFCPYCGNRVAEKMTYCPQCGEKLKH